MKNKSRCFALVDMLYIAMMIVPIIIGIVIKIITRPVGEGVSIAGAQVYFTISMPIQDLIISESQINSLLVMICIFGLCLYLTHGLKTRNISKRQHLAEWIIEKTDNMVSSNMGEFFISFSPFIIAMLALSGFSSLITLFGLYAPTSDLNIVGGWAILVFILITYYKFKCGPLQYMKSFAEPVALLAPMNIISEIATPVSMAFRHYGNVLSGSVISVLIAYALGNLSNLLLGFLPGVLGDIPLFRIGIPAVLSIYFDVFSGLLQAYIFSMLTMMYVSGGFPADLYFERKNKKVKN